MPPFQDENDDKIGKLNKEVEAMKDRCARYERGMWGQENMGWGYGGGRRI
jgi:hypothetical protein